MRKAEPMRILVAFGARPEIIKLGPVCQALRRKPQVTMDVFWTGQHLELAAGLLDLFDIPVTFNAGTSVMQQPGLGSKLGEMTRQIEQALLRGQYDWVVVQGDTATATAAAIAGFLCRVPVAHVEAGLRTGDLQSPWPEEFNRRVITVATTLHFAPTARAAFNLRRENVPETNIRVVGNSVVDALLYTRDRVASGYRPIEPALAALPTDKKLVLATTHRHENIGDPIRYVLRALRTLGEDGDKLVGLPAGKTPEQAVHAALKRLRGAFALVYLFEGEEQSANRSAGRGAARGRLRRGRDVSGVRRARARALHRPRCPSRGRRLGRRDARGRRHSRCVGQAGQAAT